MDLGSWENTTGLYKATWNGKGSNCKHFGGTLVEIIATRLECKYTHEICGSC